MTRIAAMRLALKTWGPLKVGVDEHTQRLWGKVTHDAILSTAEALRSRKREKEVGGERGHAYGATGKKRSH